MSIFLTAYSAASRPLVTPLSSSSRSSARMITCWASWSAQMCDGIVLGLKLPTLSMSSSVEVF